MCLKFIMCFHFFHNVYFPMLVYIGGKRMYFQDFFLSSIEAINTHTGENPSYFFNNTLLMEHLLYIQENLSLTSLFLEKMLVHKRFFLKYISTHSIFNACIWQEWQDLVNIANNICYWSIDIINIMLFT